MQLEVYLDPSFPLDEVENIGKTLESSGGLVAGYIPPQAGMLSVPGLIYARHIHGLSTTILPDRNLVSRMASAARHGVRRPLDEPTRLAINVMAFAQSANIAIEPSIAFHELAHRDGNDCAQEELSWFRTADQGRLHAWLDLAMERADRLPIAAPAEFIRQDLARPLARWRRNYLVALKVAELELTEMHPMEKVKELIGWMMSDFIIARPSAIFSTMYLSADTPRKRMIKSLRSVDRSEAIRGIRNAAWDITHLSYFAQRSSISAHDRARYIFATADKNLAQIAPVLIGYNQMNTQKAELSRSLGRWWTKPKEAEQVVQWLTECFQIADIRPPPGNIGSGMDPLGSLIREAEARVYGWKAS